MKAFESWLGGVVTLTGPQRRRAWQTLALSEAADSGNIEPGMAPEQALSRLDWALDDPRPTRPPPAS